jgi:hypothetical protein
MLRVEIVDAAGKHLTPQQLATAPLLRQAITEAQRLIADCERLVLEKEPRPAAARKANLPYMT